MISRQDLADRGPAEVIVYSDLDGTLLDHDTYGYEPARPALDLLRKNKIPLILCSSKTRAEMAGIRQELGLEDPFIVENGGAIYIPRKTCPVKGRPFREQGEFQVIELGVPYDQLVGCLREIRKETGLRLLGFSDLSVGQVAAITGLDRAAAALARQREYSEPFLLEEEIPSTGLLERAARLRKLHLVRGGTFFSLDRGQRQRESRSPGNDPLPGEKSGLDDHRPGRQSQ